MTLRADIRAAYDEITPPVPALEAQIRTLVAVEGNGGVQSRHRRGQWVAGLRGTMALVAALLVVLIVATVLVGGRVWHDWNVFTNRPAPAGQIDPVQLAALEARPLHVPVVSPDAICPAGPNASASAAASFPEPIHGWALQGFISGEGPVYATNSAGGGPESAWGSYRDVIWVTEPQVTGLVLIRGLDAENHQVPVVYVGQYAAGAVLGTDTVNGTRVLQRAELVLDAGHHPATSGKSKWGIYDVRAGIPNTMSNCHAFQIDGEGFSEVFVTG
jgi:hypothetical protein